MGSEGGVAPKTLMSAQGHEPTWRYGGAMSALPSKTDIPRRSGNVSFGPGTDLPPALSTSISWSDADQLNERQVPIPKSYFGADGIAEE